MIHENPLEEKRQAVFEAVSVAESLKPCFSVCITLPFPIWHGLVVTVVSRHLLKGQEPMVHSSVDVSAGLNKYVSKLIKIINK